MKKTTAPIPGTFLSCCCCLGKDEPGFFRKCLVSNTTNTFPDTFCDTVNLNDLCHRGGKVTLHGLNEASHPCEKTLPESGSRPAQEAAEETRLWGRGCFGPKGPGPKEEKDADTSWQLSALQPVRTALGFCCPRLGDQRCSLCSGPERITFARKHR